MRGVNGLHHITAIAGPAQENLDFYAGILGMRLVKKSVNQDDPGTYHLFYADAEGHPGSDLTFFPWAEMAPPRLGHGLAIEVALEVPSGSLDFWHTRLEKYGVATGVVERRFADHVLPIIDPHGLKVALVEPGRVPDRSYTPWDGSSVPHERQVRGLYGAQVWEREAAMTESFVTTVLGFERLAEDNGLVRYGFEGSAGVLASDPERIADVTESQRKFDYLIHRDGQLVAPAVEQLDHEMGDAGKGIALTDIGEVIIRTDFLARLDLAQLQGESRLALQHPINLRLWRHACSNRGQALRRIHHGKLGIGLKPQKRTREREIQDLSAAVLEEHVGKDPAFDDIEEA